MRGSASLPRDGRGVRASPDRLHDVGRCVAGWLTRPKCYEEKDDEYETMSTIRHGVAVLALLSVVPAWVGAQEENELDRFMARVLEQQERNAAPRLE